jgi:hypothetical protein
MAAKKKWKRPPRQFWVLMGDDEAFGVFRTRKAALADGGKYGLPTRVVGPYVLAERVSER